MLGSALAVIGIFVLFYVGYVIIKSNRDRGRMREELQNVYNVGLKEYNRLIISKSNQIHPPIISKS